MAAAVPAAHRGSDSYVPVGYIEITGQASELVPTGQYANVTIGPVAVRRLIVDDFDLRNEDVEVSDAEAARLRAEIEAVQVNVEHVIAEQRGLVEDSLRHHNSKD